MTDSQMMNDKLREDDVVSLLRRHHEMMREMFKELDKASGPRRAEAFQRLARMMAMHEAAEEEVVHPFVREHIKGGEQIARERIREEDEAKTILTELMERGPEDRSFQAGCKRLREMMLKHYEAEEREEFPKLVKESTEADRRTMGEAIKAAAQAVTPTESRLGSPDASRLGSPEAIMERTREVIRRTMGKGPKATM